MEDFTQPSSSFFELFSKRLKDDDPFLTFYSGADKVSDFSFKQFFDLGAALAVHLKNQYSISHGDRIFIQAQNSDSFLLHTIATWLLGASVVLISPNEDEKRVQHFTEVLNPKLILKDPLSPAKGIPSSPQQGQDKIEDLLETFGKLEASNTALFIFTSGTTSRPKCVPLSFKNLLHNAESMRRLHFKEKTTHMCVLPLCHVNAFNLSFLGTLYSGSRLVLNRDFFLPAFWEILKNERARFGAIVPRIVEILLRFSSRFYKRNSENDCKYFVSAAAPLSPQSVAQFREKFLPRLVQGFGMSEAVNFSATVPPEVSAEEYDFAMGRPNEVSIGQEVWANTINIVNEKGVETDEGCVGELILRGENVMSGYLLEEDNKEAFLEGGLRTGDLGLFRTFQDKKYFFLKGRKKEIIKRNGIQYSPVEIENTVRDLCDLEDWVIVGYPNKWTGEEVGLVLAGTPQAEEKTNLLLGKMRDKLGEDKAPKNIAWTQTIPRTDTGKVKRRLLSDLFAEYAEENRSGAHKERT